MTLEQKIRQEIERFRQAIYGEDVQDSYADIAETVCIEAMRALDHAVEQGDYAESQGNYAKNQGDYAKDKGTYAKEQADSAISRTDAVATEIRRLFEGILETLHATESGDLLLQIREKLNQLEELYSELQMVTNEEIDSIAAGTYVDKTEHESFFEYVTNEDIDNIAAGTYVDKDEGKAGDITDGDIQDIIDKAF